MFLFWRILLSHVLGDFPLQTDTVYYLKVRTKLGSLLHGMIFVLLNILLGWPYLGHISVLIYLIGIGLLHALIDGMKIAYKNRYAQGETIVTFILDQLMHLAVIFPIILLRLPAPATLSTTGLAGLYYNDKFIFYSIAYIFISFGGLIFSTALKNTFSKTIVKINSIPVFERTYGLLERSLLAFLVMAGHNFWPLAIVISPRLIRPFKKKIGGWGDSFINYSLGLCIGLILRRIYG